MGRRQVRDSVKDGERTQTEKDRDSNMEDTSIGRGRRSVATGAEIDFRILVPLKGKGLQATNPRRRDAKTQ